MEILFLRSNSVDPDIRVEKEINTLKKLEYKISVFCWDRSKNSAVRKEKILENIDIYRKGIKAGYSQGFKKNLIPLLNFQINIFLFLYKNRKKIKIIHACDFDTAFMAYIFSIIFKKILIYDVFDYYVDSFNVPNILRKLIVYLDKKVMEFSNTVIICSEERKIQIGNPLIKNLVVIHNTPEEIISEKNVSPRDENNKEIIKIAYIGILPEKGRMIKELVEIVAENKDKLELHIGGFGALENYLKEKSKDNDNIIFYGKIGYDRTIKIEKNCDIMTAIYDPQIKNHIFAAPNKFYESLMLGKPLIMVRGTGMSKIIKENNIGELIEFNKGSLEKALLKLINRKSEWENIERKMKQLYNEEFSWEKMEKKIIEIYSIFYKIL